MPVRAGRSGKSGSASRKCASRSRRTRNLLFQSPSRGGHLRGGSRRRLWKSMFPVSVPFARGTPPWRIGSSVTRWDSSGFSPLREGDTSVAGRRQLHSTDGRNVSVPFARGTPPWLPAIEDDATSPFKFQSPSRGGHLRGRVDSEEIERWVRVSVPFARGTPPWLALYTPPFRSASVSVPFARGTPPWQWPRRGLRCPTTTVSVPFARGTPPWHRGGVRGAGQGSKFQSPSRGGHLRGKRNMTLKQKLHFVSVPFARGTPPWHSLQSIRATTMGCFSPLREGDTSVAMRTYFLGARAFLVSVPFARGTPPWRLGTIVVILLICVSVPFARGTPPWLLHKSYSHIELCGLQFANSAQIAFLLGIPANPRGFVYHTSAQ